jgi:hypothetical protein
VGIMNVTTNNTATHCIFALAPPKLLVDTPNVVLLNQFLDNPCARSTKLVPGFGIAGGHQ